MAKTLTPLDAHALVESIAHQITGQTALAVTSTADFVSVGEQILSYGTENVLNTISLITGKSYIAARPYSRRLRILNKLSTGDFTHRFRKISYYSKDPKSAGAFNTQLNGANLGMGRDNQAQGTLDGGAGSAVPSMWEQNPAVPLEVNFTSMDVWDYTITVYEKALKQAFRSEEEFIRFINGYFVEAQNDIESEMEALNYAALLNFMACIYDLDSANPNGRVVNVTAAFNGYFGTSYSSHDLLTTHIKEFNEFFVTLVKTASDYMTHRSSYYHWSPTKVVNGVSYELLRHTPKEKQKLIMYGPVWKYMEATVLPEIFNDQYLKIDNFEKVDYWQDFGAGAQSDMQINITPAIPDLNTTGYPQIAGTTVNTDVLGILFDEDAIAVDMQMEMAATSPLEARKLYRNIVNHYSYGLVNDPTENAILFIMEDN